MEIEIDLLKHYQKQNGILASAGRKTEEDRIVARKFGEEFLTEKDTRLWGIFVFAKFWNQSCLILRSFMG